MTNADIEANNSKQVPLLDEEVPAIVAASDDVPHKNDTNQDGASPLKQKKIRNLTTDIEANDGKKVALLEEKLLVIVAAGGDDVPNKNDTNQSGASPLTKKKKMTRKEQDERVNRGILVGLGMMIVLMWFAQKDYHRYLVYRTRLVPEDAMAINRIVPSPHSSLRGPGSTNHRPTTGNKNTVQQQPSKGNIPWCGTVTKNRGDSSKNNNQGGPHNEDGKEITSHSFELKSLPGEQRPVSVMATEEKKNHDLAKETNHHNHHDHHHHDGHEILKTAVVPPPFSGEHYHGHDDAIKKAPFVHRNDDVISKKVVYLLPKQSHGMNNEKEGNNRYHSRHDGKGIMGGEALKGDGSRPVERLSASP